MFSRSLASLVLVLVVGCSSSSESTGSSVDAFERALDAAAEGAETDAASDGGTTTHLACTSSFGSGLTAGSHGRLDGTLVAVVDPHQHGCSADAHHLHLQIAMQGSVYDVSVNVDGVYLGETDASLVGEPWSEGWHPNAPLDYPTSLGLHSSAFTSIAQSPLVQKLEAILADANQVSIFATKYDRSGTHLVHRNEHGNDGAIVLDPLSATPHYLVFHFPNQAF